jgi:hypothetical protein
LQRKLKIALVLLCAAAFIIAAYAFLNMPLYGNALPPYNSERNPLNLVFKFGVGGLNELDTFHGTFTKDLCIDGTVTARMILSEAELKEIQLKLIEFDFFSCPETFPLSEHMMLPSSSYYLEVQNGTTLKEVSWSDNSIIDGSTATKLDQIAAFLTDLIYQKPEYTRLPPANGMYL